MAAVPEEPNDRPRSATAAPTADVERAVRAALALHGPSLLFDGECLRETLLRDAPTFADERDWLLDAQACEVPQQLVAVHVDDDLPARLETLATALAAQRGMSPAAASWAVATWARILDVATGPKAAPAVALPMTEPVADADAAVDRRRPTIGSGPATTAVRAGSGGYLRVALVIVLAAVSVWFGFFQRSLKIADVSSSGALVADGSEHDVTIGFDARRATVRRVEVRDLAAAAASPRVLDVAPTAADKGRVAAGRITLRSDTPRRVAYRYVLVADDGLRSAPFDKSFDFVPGPPRPPRITGTTAPADLVAGKPFAVDIAYEVGSRPIAQVEMRVASSTVPWKREVASIPWVAPATGSPAVVRYPFDAGLRPSRTAVDFTVIDGDGVRSAPQRVVLDVRRPGPISACTATTCGRVVATREIAPPNAVVGFFRRVFATAGSHPEPSWQITVRRDDGATRVVDDLRPWKAGTRVRIAGKPPAIHCADGAGRC